MPKRHDEISHRIKNRTHEPRGAGRNYRAKTHSSVSRKFALSAPDVITLRTRHRLRGDIVDGIIAAANGSADLMLIKVSPGMFPYTYLPRVVSGFSRSLRLKSRDSDGATFAVVKNTRISARALACFTSSSPPSRYTYTSEPRLRLAHRNVCMRTQVPPRRFP